MQNYHIYFILTYFTQDDPHSAIFPRGIEYSTISTEEGFDYFIKKNMQVTSNASRSWVHHKKGNTKTRQ